MTLLLANKIRNAVLVACALFGSDARALTINNKAAFPAHVTIKDEAFRPIRKVKIPAGGVYQFLEAGREQDIFQIETYIADPKDTIGTPTFHHQVKFHETICVPLSHCLDKPAKKS